LNDGCKSLRGPAARVWRNGSDLDHVRIARVVPCAHLSPAAGAARRISRELINVFRPRESGAKADVPLRRQSRPRFRGAAHGSIDRTLPIADGVGRAPHQAVPLSGVIAKQVKSVPYGVIADIASVQRTDSGLAE